MKKVKQEQLDTAYVYELAVEVYTEQLDKSSLYMAIGGIRSPMERVIKAYMKQWNSTRERAEQRYREHAQICAPTVRAVLKILQARGELKID
jgi:hypothetical protein